MKNLNFDNPLPTAGAAEALGLSILTVRAIKRSLGIKGRYIFLSVAKKFLRDNPGFMPTRVYHNDSCHCKMCRSKRVTLPVAASAVAPAPLQPVSPVVTRSHSSLGRMVKKIRKRQKISTAWLAQQTGLSMSCIYKLEKTGEVSIDVLDKVAKEICPTHAECMTLVAQWIREHVGNRVCELRIETIDKDDQGVTETAAQEKADGKFFRFLRNRPGSLEGFCIFEVVHER